MRAALIEKHVAFLVDERLKQLEFGFGELNLRCDRAHISWCGNPWRRRGEALPGNRDGFHGLLELPVFGLAQKPGNVQKDDEAPLELADSRHIVGFAVCKYGARG